MSKKYKLLKDLPGVKSGTIFTEDYGDDTYGYNADNGADCRIRRWNVEMFPQWFSEIIEPSNKERWSETDGFVAACKALEAIMKNAKDDASGINGLWSIGHINDFQDELLKQGYSIQPIPSNKQETKEVFTWDRTDEGFLNYLIKQKEDNVRRHDFETAAQWRMIERLYRSHLKIEKLDKPAGSYVSVEKVVEDYIQSKQPSRSINEEKDDYDNGVGIAFPDKKPQPQNNKERIEVSELCNEIDNRHSKYPCTYNVSYLLGCHNLIPKEKLPLIKQAIESVLNGEPINMAAQWMGAHYFDSDGEKLFTKEQLDKARIDAFNAARETAGSYSNCIGEHPQYPTLQDYLNLKK